MVDVRPFHGLRPDPSLAEQMVSLPYDVMDRSQARDLANGKPFSFLRVIRADLEFPDEISPYTDQVYQRSQENFKSYIQKKALFYEDQSSYYIYRINIDAHQQTGLVALFSAKDYLEERIKKHEFTQKQKEKDRIRHIQCLHAHTGLIFLLYRKQKLSTLSKQLDDYADKSIPLYDLSFSSENSRHRLYRIDSQELTRQLKVDLSKLDCLYIADGHHRSASAAQAALQRSKETDDDKAAYFLAVAFPDNQVQILPYYRIVRNYKGFLNGGEFLRALEQESKKHNISVQKGRYTSLTDYQCNMCVEGEWYRLKWPSRKDKDADILSSLPVNILQQKILQPLLGITDPRTSDNLDFVGGIHGEEGLANILKQKGYVLGFSMAPVQTEQLLSVADAGQIMPPKSTWFEPKLRSGLIINSFDS